MSPGEARQGLAQQIGEFYAMMLLKAGFRSKTLTPVVATRAAQHAQRAEGIIRTQETKIRTATATGVVTASQMFECMRMGIEAGNLRAQCDVLAGTGASYVLRGEPLMSPSILLTRASLECEHPFEVRLVTWQPKAGEADTDPDVICEAKIFVHDPDDGVQGPAVKDLRHYFNDPEAVIKWMGDVGQAAHRADGTMLTGAIKVQPNQLFTNLSDVKAHFTDAPIPKAPKQAETVRIGTMGAVPRGMSLAG